MEGGTNSIGVPIRLHNDVHQSQFESPDVTLVDVGEFRKGDDRSVCHDPVASVLKTVNETTVNTADKMIQDFERQLKDTRMGLEEANESLKKIEDIRSGCEYDFSKAVASLNAQKCMRRSAIDVDLLSIESLKKRIDDNLSIIERIDNKIQEEQKKKEASMDIARQFTEVQGSDQTVLEALDLMQTIKEEARAHLLKTAKSMTEAIERLKRLKDQTCKGLFDKVVRNATDDETRQSVPPVLPTPLVSGAAKKRSENAVKSKSHESSKKHKADTESPRQLTEDVIHDEDEDEDERCAEEEEDEVEDEEDTEDSDPPSLVNGKPSFGASDVKDWWESMKPVNERIYLDKSLGINRNIVRSSSVAWYARHAKFAAEDVLNKTPATIGDAAFFIHLVKLCRYCYTSQHGQRRLGRDAFISLIKRSYDLYIGNEVGTSRRFARDLGLAIVYAYTVSKGGDYTAIRTTLLTLSKKEGFPSFTWPEQIVLENIRTIRESDDNGTRKKN